MRFSLSRGAAPGPQLFPPEVSQEQTTPVACSTDGRGLARRGASSACAHPARCGRPCAYDWEAVSPTCRAVSMMWALPSWGVSRPWEPRAWAGNVPSLPGVRGAAMAFSPLPQGRDTVFSRACTRCIRVRMQEVFHRQAARPEQEEVHVRRRASGFRGATRQRSVPWACTMRATGRRQRWSAMCCISGEPCALFGGW